MTVHKCWKFASAALESQGYSVKFASNGYDAIRALEEASVAAILLLARMWEQQERGKEKC